MMCKMFCRKPECVEDAELAIGVVSYSVALDGDAELGSEEAGKVKE